MANNTPPQQKNRIPSKASYELVVFADCLNPSPSYITEGKKRVQDVFKTFQVDPNFSISRSFFGGSVGKSTSIIFPDFDCVIFMNRKVPPLTEMVDEFARILREKAVVLQIDVNSITKSRITVSFEFTNGVEMDLLPACSFAQFPEEQYKEVLKRLKDASDPKPYLGYSSSLAEIQLEFMKTQSGATHQLVRIAKYWYKLCTFDYYIYGGSSLIEIICVAAALELDSDGGKQFQMLQAFKKFLKKVSTIKTQKIAFYYENKKFVKVDPKEFTLPKYKNHFCEKILTRKNFIIEPANPYNDLAINIKDASLKRLVKFANEMHDRLDKLESTESNPIKTLSADGKEIDFVHYDKLFAPFILCLKDYYPNSAIPTYICIEYFYQNYSSAHADAVVNAAGLDFFKGNQNAKFVYQAVKNTLLFLIRGKAQRNLRKGPSFNEGVAQVEKDKDVKAAVQTFIEANFGVKQFVKESSSNKDHQTYHVTLNIPYRRMDGRIFAVRFSMKWSS